MRTNAAIFNSVATLILFGWTHLALAGDPIDWRRLINDRATKLKTCGIPVELEAYHLQRPPAQRLSALHTFPAAEVSDGCTITVYSTEDKKQIFVVAEGGISGHISIYLGPFSPDGSDF